MLIRDTERWAMTATEAAQRKNYGSKSELALRAALEQFCRDRWPAARIVHEIVMGEGRVRADAAAIGTNHIAAFEIKGEYDETTRLLHQVGMYQLCVPEVWMVVPKGRHAEDAQLIRHLLPSVGLLVGTARSDYNYYEFDPQYGLRVEAEAAPRPVVPEMMLRMLWRDELAWACNQSRCCSAGPKTTRSVMVKALLGLPIAELQQLVCGALRGRDALWRADPVVPA